MFLIFAVITNYHHAQIFFCTRTVALFGGHWTIAYWNNEKRPSKTSEFILLKNTDFAVRFYRTTCTTAATRVSRKIISPTLYKKKKIVHDFYVFIARRSYTLRVCDHEVSWTRFFCLSNHIKTLLANDVWTVAPHAWKYFVSPELRMYIVALAIDYNSYILVFIINCSRYAGTILTPLGGTPKVRMW